MVGRRDNFSESVSKSQSESKSEFASEPKPFVFLPFSVQELQNLRFSRILGLSCGSLPSRFWADFGSVTVWG